MLGMPIMPIGAMPPPIPPYTLPPLPPPYTLPPPPPYTLPPLPPPYTEPPLPNPAFELRSHSSPAICIACWATAIWYACFATRRARWCAARYVGSLLNCDIELMPVAIGCCQAAQPGIIPWTPFSIVTLIAGLRPRGPMSSSESSCTSGPRPLTILPS